MSRLQILRYKAYMFTSSSASNSKALGFCTDLGKRMFAKDELHASQEFFEQNAARVERICSRLADEKSREEYRSLIQYRCCRERRFVNSHMQSKKTAYLDKELIVPKEREVFVDIGAFQGNSSLLFQDVCISAGRPAPQCILFEPDPFNFARLQENLPKFIKQPDCFPIWDSGAKAANAISGTDAFSMSKIDSSGEGTIQVDTLDHVLERLPALVPTYIKIDVEGADLDVLYGAQQTLRKHHPRIAVAIYHNDAHMLEISEAIHAICPSYRLFVRHYSCLEGETILYCL